MEFLFCDTLVGDNSSVTHEHFVSEILWLFDIEQILTSKNFFPADSVIKNITLTLK